MIIFLYGTDGYRLKQNLEKLTEEYKRKHASGANLLVLNFDENPAEQLDNFEKVLKTVSFFDEKKLVVLKNCFDQGSAITNLLKDYKLGADRETIVIVVENLSKTELNKKDKKLLAMLAAKPNVVKAFDPLTGRPLETWLAKEAETLGATIETVALRKLIVYAGTDSWRLRRELEKLANYSRPASPELQRGEPRAINESAVELLVAPNINLKIFDTIDALAYRDRVKALVLLARHLEAGDDPHYLFSMIIYQFRNLLRVKSLMADVSATVPTPAAIAQKMGLHPFVARKMFDQARKFELEELKRKFSQLAESDIEIKTGQIDIEDCLYRIALET